MTLGDVVSLLLVGVAIAIAAFTIGYILSGRRR